MKHINTVCLTVIASRNLSTLLTTCCMLHPKIQTLNHYYTINQNTDTDFIVDYTDEKHNNFINKVDEVNASGEYTPGLGGVTTKSHAFNDNSEVREVYRKRFGGSETREHTHKPRAQSIVWKDSAKNTKILMNRDMDALIKANPKLRFLVCVRNPLDTAESIDHSGYASNFRSNEKMEILKELFERYEWFFDLKEKYPDNFMCIFPDEINNELLRRLEDFLEVDHDEQWVEDFKLVFINKSKYIHSDIEWEMRDQLIKLHIPKKYHYNFEGHYFRQ